MWVKVDVWDRWEQRTSDWRVAASIPNRFATVLVGRCPDGDVILEQLGPLESQRDAETRALSLQHVPDLVVEGLTVQLAIEMCNILERRP